MSFKRSGGRRRERWECRIGLLHEFDGGEDEAGRCNLRDDEPAQNLDLEADGRRLDLGVEANFEVTQVAKKLFSGLVMLRFNSFLVSPKLAPDLANLAPELGLGLPNLALDFFDVGLRRHRVAQGRIERFGMRARLFFLDACFFQPID